jgi:hypothetical protein
MAGVLELIKGSQPQRRLLGVSMKTPWVDPKVLELLAAKEILAEVFGMKISEAEEMVRQRTEEGEQSFQEEAGLWPESFSLVK